MADEFTLVLSMGEYYAVRYAIERFQAELLSYEKQELTKLQRLSVQNSKKEVARVLDALSKARSQYLRGPAKDTPDAQP